MTSIQLASVSHSCDWRMRHSLKLVERRFQFGIDVDIRAEIIDVITVIGRTENCHEFTVVLDFVTLLFHFV